MRFVRKKVVQLVVVLLCVTFLSFLMINMLPGDTAAKLCAGAGGQECIDQKRAVAAFAQALEASGSWYSRAANNRCAALDFGPGSGAELPPRYWTRVQLGGVDKIIDV